MAQNNTTQHNSFQIPAALSSILKSISLEKLSAHFANSDLVVQPLHDRPLVFDFWMGMILLANPDMKILIKLHYNSEAVAKLFKADISSSGTSDIIKEFCNLYGGAIKGVLSNYNISVGLSLPLVVRGFDEIYDKNIHSLNAKECWILTNGPLKVVCDVRFELTSSNTLTQLDQITQHHDQGGEIEFL